MAKYIFTSDWFTTPQYTFVGKDDSKTFKKGEIIEGNLLGNGAIQTTSNGIKYLLIKAPIVNQSSGGVKKPFLSPAAKVGLGVLGGVAFLIIAIKIWK